MAVVRFRSGARMIPEQVVRQRRIDSRPMCKAGRYGYWRRASLRLAIRREQNQQSKALSYSVSYDGGSHQIILRGSSFVIMKLREKVCLVTGGNSGIGAATTALLARKDARIVVASRMGADREPDEIAKLASRDAAIHFVRADVADPDACRNCVEEAVRTFGRLDAVIHSAGANAPGGLFTVSDEEWMHAFAVHVHSVFHLARAAAPVMAKQGSGSITLIGSAAGLRGCAGALAYGVVKGALPQFARSLARELADDNIRVNCVSPGVIRTPFQDSLPSAQAINNIKNRIPLHREGTPEEVAQLIVSLIENDFITGENFVIDGGMTMRIV